MNRIVYSIIIFLFLFGNTFAQSPLSSAVKQLADSEMLKYGDVSIAIIDVESGKTVASHRPNTGLTPASSLKVVTTATALALLGENYRFETTIEYDGAIDATGILNGNLYIKGHGDPVLGSDLYEDTPDLDALMQAFVGAIQKAGINKINGRIVGDGSYYETAVSGRSWLWEDLGNYYGSGAWGLNIHENLYYLYFQQSPKLGATPKIVRTTPAIPNLLLMNEIKSAGKGTGDNAYIFGSPFSYTRFIRGTIPIGSKEFKIKGSIPDPPFFAAHCLMKNLESNGVVTNKLATSQLELEREGNTKKTRKLIYTHQSPTLKDIVIVANQKSVNLYCESLLRAIGKKKSNEGSVKAGLDAIYDFWKARGVNVEGFFMEDGSGLSVRNSVSAHHLASIMRKIAKDKNLYDTFNMSLAVGGQSGTLKRMFKGTVGEGNVRAKSGGMTRVRSYTGYARSKSGKLLAFCMIANNFTGESSTMRKKMEKLMIAMCQ